MLEGVALPRCGMSGGSARWGSIKSAQSGAEMDESPGGDPTHVLSATMLLGGKVRSFES